MCWKCKNNIDSDGFISRTQTCPVCNADLHCCKNCVYYAPGSHYDCHETVDELVKDKERANFCDSFKIKKVFSGEGNASSGTDKAAEAKKAFASLFGD